MELDQNFEPVSDTVSIPDKLLEKTIAYCEMKLRRVDVERKTGKSSWNKVNGFKLGQDVSGNTKDEPEKIASMIVGIAMAAVEDEGDDGVFRAKFYVTEDNGREARKHCSFRQLLNDDNDTEPMRDFDAVEDPQAVMNAAFNQALSLISIQTQHIENQNHKLLEASTMSTTQIQQLLSTHETLINKYHEGLTMQANALTLMLDVERNMEAEKQKGANAAKLIGLMEMALPAAMTQLAVYMRDRNAQQSEEAPEDDEDHDDEDDNEETSAGTQAQPDPERQAMERKIKEKPLTTFAHAFKDSLTAEQLMDLSAAVTKKQMTLLKTATSQETDPETADAIVKLRDSLMKSPQTFGKLQEILSDKQVQMVMRLMQMAAQAAAVEEADD